MGTRIAIAGEVWSSNLGDPLIHRCLSSLVLRTGVAEVVSIDLEDRCGFAHEQPGGGQRIRLPPTLRAAAWWGLRRRRRSAAWARQLAGCSALLIGGGQLLDDMGMLFPPRLAALAETAERLRVPVAIVCCGASPTWTPLARLLLRGRMARVLRAILVRDQASAQALASAFPAWPPAQVAPDPAVWAARLLSVRVERGGTAPLGLGIGRLDGLDAEASLSWWRALLAELAARRLPCALFSNGAAEDEALKLRLDTGGIAAAECPRTPEALVATVARHRCIASPRLHAAIAAFSAGVPALSLSQQGKFTGFWSQVGLPERAVGVPHPLRTAELLAQVFAGPGDPPAALADAQESVAQAVASLLAQLR